MLYCPGCVLKRARFFCVCNRVFPERDPQKWRFRPSKKRRSSLSFARMQRTLVRPKFKLLSSPSGSTDLPITCAPTNTTFTRGEVSSSWWDSGADSSRTWRARTWSGTARRLHGSGFASSVQPAHSQIRITCRRWTMKWSRAQCPGPFHRPLTADSRDQWKEVRRHSSSSPAGNACPHGVLEPA
jgi:hypothetical protein